MIQHLPRRAVLLLAAAGLAATSAAAAACGGIGKPPNPDPGSRRLHALAADPVFARLPPGAVRTSWQENPAKYRSDLFGGSGWDGPSVILTFTSPQSVLDVYRFYAERAHEAGWTPIPGKTLTNGLIWAWSKHIDAKPSGITIFDNFDTHSVDVTETGTPRSYSVNGST
jgi:hypothetical protein